MKESFLEMCYMCELKDKYWSKITPILLTVEAKVNYVKSGVIK